MRVRHIYLSIIAFLCVSCATTGSRTPCSWESQSGLLAEIYQSQWLRSMEETLASHDELAEVGTNGACQDDRFVAAQWTPGEPCLCCVLLTFEGAGSDKGCSRTLAMLRVFHESPTYDEALRSAEGMMRMSQHDSFLDGIRSADPESPLDLIDSVVDVDTRAIRNLSFRLFQHGGSWVWQFQEDRASVSH